MKDMSSKPMSSTAYRLYEYMLSREGEDVPIRQMFKVISEIPGAVLEPEDDGEARRQQQYVGAYVSRINGRSKGHKIVPGDVKRTYRLVAKK